MKKYLINLFLFGISTIILLPFVSFAAMIEPLSGINITDFISKILDYIVKFGTVLAAVVLVFNGYLFASARGNAGTLDKAKDAFIKTLIFLVILLGAKIIGNMILSTLDKII